MQNKNSTINYGIKHNDETTYFFQLSNNEKREFFFRILWGDLKPLFYYDGVENREENITNIDHVSFHESGEYHVTYYKEKNKKGRIRHKKLINTIKTMPQTAYVPLLILSIYSIDMFVNYIGRTRPLRFDNVQNISIELDSENIKRFSVVIFLVGSEVNYELMLNNQFPGMFNIHVSPFIMNFFGDESKVELNKNNEVVKVNDLGLLIACTDKVIPNASAQVKFEKNISREFSRVENPLGMSLIPSDEKIRSLI